MQAHGRFLDALQTNDEALWYAALGETLWWIFALNDYYEKSGHKKVYLEHRDKSPYGFVIPGLKYARNEVGHGLALLIDYSHATRRLAPDKVDLRQLCWRHLDKGYDKVNSYGRESQSSCYERLLAGNAVRYSLRRANKYFIRQMDGLDKALQG